MGRAIHPMSSSPRWPTGTCIPAACEFSMPFPAGAPTGSVKPTPRRDRSPTWLPGVPIAARITGDRTITCWGDTNHSQATPTGRASRHWPPVLPTPAGYDLRNHHCWGNNKPQPSHPTSRHIHHHHRRTIPLMRRLPTTSQRLVGVQRPRPSHPTSSNYTTITAGQSHSCAVSQDQTVTCWGRLPLMQYRPG